FLGVLTYRTGHNETHRQRGVGRLFSSGSLDEVGAGHHRNEAGASNIAKSKQISCSENYFHVGGAACLFVGGDLVVKSLPSATEDVRPRDHNVNIWRCSLDGAANFG